MTIETLDATEIGRRAEDIYTKQIKAEVEPEHIGEIVAVDVDSGDYEVDESLVVASRRLRQRRPDGTFFALRAGYDSVAAIGTKLRRTG